MVINQKRLNFLMKRHCKIQDNMGGNGLGNRCFLGFTTVRPPIAMRTQCGHSVF